MSFYMFTGFQHDVMRRWRAGPLAECACAAAVTLHGSPVQHHRSRVSAGSRLSAGGAISGNTTTTTTTIKNMSVANDFGNPLRKFKLVFLGEQSGECHCRRSCFILFIYLLL